jgi:hypothetical protein
MVLMIISALIGALFCDVAMLVGCPRRTWASLDINHVSASPGNQPEVSDGAPKMEDIRIAMRAGRQYFSTGSLNCVPELPVSRGLGEIICARSGWQKPLSDTLG